METTADPAAEIAERIVADIGAKSPGRKWLTADDVRSYIAGSRFDTGRVDALVTRVLAQIRARCRAWGPGVVGTKADGAARPFTIFVVIGELTDQATAI